MIDMFKTDKSTAISVEARSSEGSNYKSVKFAYDGGEMVISDCLDLGTRIVTPIRYS